MTGRMYDERLGKWHFWSTFVFLNLTFAPMHILDSRGCRDASRPTRANSPA